MAFNQRIAFEVDAATGSDSNGGGFDDTTGTPGTNFAWGAGQLATAITDLACAGAGSTFTSATLSALSGGAACVGNVINVTSGANATTGRYQILSQASGTFTVDRAISTGAVSGGAGTLGGSLLTIQKGIDCAFINAGAVADSRVYIKKGAYTGTVALTTSGAVSSSKRYSRILGYFTAHDDTPTVASGNQPTFAVGSGAGVNGLTLLSSGFFIASITLVGTATSGTKGAKGVNFSSNASFSTLYNCKIDNFTSEGFDAGLATNDAQVALLDCEVTRCGSGTAAVRGLTNGSMNGLTVERCYIHDNVGAGIDLDPGAGGSGAVIDCIIANNLGASSDGVRATYAAVIRGNTIYGNGRDGVRSTFGSTQGAMLVGVCRNNIFAKNAGYGFNLVNAPAAPNAFLTIDYNAFYANTLGARNNIAASQHDVDISANPFNSSDANLAAGTNPDWGLNSTAAAGAALRAAGSPGIPGLATTTGYRDIGAVQHQDSAKPRGPMMVGMGAALQGGVY